MLTGLFSSRVRVELLTLFFTHPEQDYYLRELQRMTGNSVSALSRELVNLKKYGILTSFRRGNIQFFRVNMKHPIYADLKSIIYKTEAVGDVIRNSLELSLSIDVALIFGSIARNQERMDSAVDLLLIGNLDHNELYWFVQNVERKTCRKVNLVTFGLEQWKEKVAHKDIFTIEILNNSRIDLMGDINEL